MKLDLDEIEASLGYHDDWKKVVAELRVARILVEYLREDKEHLDECDCKPCHCGYAYELQLIKDYDEVANAANT